MAAQAALSEDTAGKLFDKLTFFIKQRVPSRSTYIQQIEVNGGTVTKFESQADIKIDDHLKKDPDSDAYSYRWIEDCIREETLVDKEPHRLGIRRPQGKAPARPVGPRAPGAGTRVHYTDEDDIFLWQWVRLYGNGRNEFGNEIYKELVKVNNRHPWQSWQARYQKYVSVNPPTGVEAEPSRLPSHLLPTGRGTLATSAAPSSAMQTTPAPARPDVPVTTTMGPPTEPVREPARTVVAPSSSSIRTNTTQDAAVMDAPTPGPAPQETPRLSPYSSSVPREVADTSSATGEAVPQNTPVNMRFDDENLPLTLSQLIWLAVEASSLLSILSDPDKDPEEAWELITDLWQTKYKETPLPAHWRDAFDKYVQPEVERSKEFNQLFMTTPEDQIRRRSSGTPASAQRARDYSARSLERWPTPLSREVTSHAAPTSLKRSHDLVQETESPSVSSPAAQKRARFKEPISTAAEIDVGMSVDGDDGAAEGSTIAETLASDQQPSQRADSVELVDLSAHVDSDGEHEDQPGDVFDIYQDHRHVEEERENEPTSPSKRIRLQPSAEHRVSVFTGEAGVSFSLEPSMADPTVDDDEWQEIPDSDDEDGPGRAEADRVDIDDASGAHQERQPSPELRGSSPDQDDAHEAAAEARQPSVELETSLPDANIDGDADQVEAPGPSQRHQWESDQDHSDSPFVDALSEPAHSRPATSEAFETAPEQLPLSDQAPRAAPRTYVQPSQSDLMGMPLPEDDDDDESTGSRSPSPEPAPVSQPVAESLSQLGPTHPVQEQPRAAREPAASAAGDDPRSSPPAVDDSPLFFPAHGSALPVHRGVNSSRLNHRDPLPSAARLNHQFHDGPRSETQTSLPSQPSQPSQHSSGNSSANMSARRVAPPKVQEEATLTVLDDDEAEPEADHEVPILHSKLRPALAKLLAYFRMPTKSPRPRDSIHQNSQTQLQKTSMPANDDVNAFFDYQEQLGREADDIECALQATMFDMALCRAALQDMGIGGDVPYGLAGCWTDDDDDDLRTGEAAAVENLKEFHGDESVSLRRAWLKKADESNNVIDLT